MSSGFRCLASSGGVLVVLVGSLLDADAFLEDVTGKVVVLLFLSLLEDKFESVSLSLLERILF